MADIDVLRTQLLWN